VFYLDILHHHEHKYCFHLNGHKLFSGTGPPMKHTTAANSLNRTLTIFNTSSNDLNSTHLFTAVASVSVKTQRAPRKHLWASLAVSESAQILYHTNIHAFINSHFPCTCKRPGLHYAHFWQPLFCEANVSIIYMTKDSLRIYYFLLLFVIRLDK